MRYLFRSGAGGCLQALPTSSMFTRRYVSFGIEAEDSACLQAALMAGRRVKLPTTGVFADGVSVAQVGKLPFALARQYVDDVVTVTTDEICAAIKTLFDVTRSIAEPAGALALAGLVKVAQGQRVKGKSLLAIVSGANMNFDRLRFVSERYAVGEGSDVLLGIRLKQGKLGRDELLARLRRQGYAIEDLSGNTLAKLHVCHMIGGRRTDASEEIYRFELPERPGILVFVRRITLFISCSWAIEALTKTEEMIVWQR